MERRAITLSNATAVLLSYLSKGMVRLKLPEDKRRTSLNHKAYLVTMYHRVIDLNIPGP
jgi:hypothetical protein